MERTANYPFGWLVEEVGHRLAQSISSMTGEDASAECVDSNTPEERLHWWEETLTFPPSAALYFGATDSAIAAMGGVVLEAAGIPPDPQTTRSTYFETLTQTMSATARTMSGKFGREVNCGTGKELVDPPSDVDGPFAIRVLAKGEKLCEVFIGVGRAFRSLIRTATAQTAAIEAPAAPAPAPPPSKHMDVLYDVELPVSVSFGRAQLALKDVIKLTTGSIVELNRAISEPVEVIVNNCVIARGEVVVVEGNYGVRIDQIITRQERLRMVK